MYLPCQTPDALQRLWSTLLPIRLSLDLERRHPEQLELESGESLVSQCSPSWHPQVTAPLMSPCLQQQKKMYTNKCTATAYLQHLNHSVNKEVHVCLYSVLICDHVMVMCEVIQSMMHTNCRTVVDCSSHTAYCCSTYNSKYTWLARIIAMATMTLSMCTGIQCSSILSCLQQVVKSHRL